MTVDGSMQGGSVDDILELAAIRLMPMFGPPRDNGPFELAPLLIAAAASAVGILWIRRSSDPGPLVRGDAKWRYRDRGRRERIANALDTPILSDRTPGWWLTRVEFGIAIALPVGLALLLIAEPQHMGGESLSQLPTTFAGFAGMALGLAWMVRIYRAGLRNDAQATWRHRDGR